MRIPAGSQGKTLACPRCQKKFRVPGPPATKPRAPVPSPPTSSSVGSGGLDDFDFGDLGTGNVAGSNPYPPPSPGFGAASAYAPPQQYASRTQPGNRSPVLYVIPGVIILIWSILVIGSGIYRLVDMGIVLATMQREIPAGAWPRIIGVIVGAILGLILYIIMAVGSVSMIRQTGLSSARTTAILASIPCFGCFVFPIGIWAAVLLFTDPVKKDFSD